MSFIRSISNNSHELFHSNLWGWLIENDHNFAKCFFEGIDAKEINKVYREKNNLDLYIVLEDGSKYILENKFKSIPEKEQLIKYVSKNEDAKEFVLVTPFKETDITKEVNDKLKLNSKKTKWVYKNYTELLKDIKEKCKSSKNEEIKKYKVVINDYCDYFLQFIKDIKKIVMKIDKYCFINDKNIKENNKKSNNTKGKENKTSNNTEEKENTKIYKSLQELKKYKSDDLINKMIGNNFYNGFIKYLGNEKNKYEIKIDFSNKSFIITIHLIGSEPYIQIEGDQYRYFVSFKIDEKEQIKRNLKREKKEYINDKKDLKGIEKEIKKYIDNKWFSYDIKDPNDKKNQKIVHGNKTNMRVLFGKYAKESYDLYQYYIIDTMTSYEDIYKNIINDLKDGKKIK